MSEWKRRAILVTGGGTGIGRATALAFAHAGARVVVADVAAREAEETVGRITADGGQALFVRADVSNPQDVRDTIEHMLRAYGRIDCAFNNAGIEGQLAETAESSDENWDRTLAVNLRGVYLCMKHELPPMLAAGRGSIVNCASVAGLVGFPGLPAYVASKHGVVGLTRSAALEYAQRGIRVNAVCPGVIRTQMIDRLIDGRPEMEARLLAPQPVGRMGTPDEVAACVMFLASDAASLITGQALAVDGGWVAK